MASLETPPSPGLATRLINRSVSIVSGRCTLLSWRGSRQLRQLILDRELRQDRLGSELRESGESRYLSPPPAFMALASSGGRKDLKRVLSMAFM